MSETFAHQIAENVIITPNERIFLKAVCFYLIKYCNLSSSIVNHKIFYKGRKKKSLKVKIKKKMAVVAKMQS